MMASTLIVYSTTDGQTLKICLRLKQLLEDLGNVVTLVSVVESGNIDITSFDKVVVGASIRYGKHSPEIYRFIKTRLQQLEQRPSAFFSVNVVARKPEKSQPETNPYLKKFLRQIAWKPRLLDVFAGRIDYQSYRFWDRLMIRLIMVLTKGPTDPQANIEFTDWDRVKAFAEAVNAL